MNGLEAHGFTSPFVSAASSDLRSELAGRPQLIDANEGHDLCLRLLCTLFCFTLIAKIICHVNHHIVVFFLSRLLNNQFLF